MCKKLQLQIMLPTYTLPSECPYANNARWKFLITSTAERRYESKMPYCTTEKNYFIVIGWEQANLLLITNLYCSAN